MHRMITARRASWLLAISSALLYGQQPVEVMLAMETAPGTEQAIGLIRARALQRGDRAGIVAVNSRAAQVVQALTSDPEAIDTALLQIGIRLGVAVGGVQINDAWTVE